MLTLCLFSIVRQVIYFDYKLFLKKSGLETFGNDKVLNSLTWLADNKLILLFSVQLVTKKNSACRYSLSLTESI
jgi:hypothetical protein